MSPGSPKIETRDVHLKKLVGFTGMLLILIGITLLITREFDRFFVHWLSLQNQLEPGRVSHQEAPEPRLQVNPTVDLVRLRDVENVTLNNYAWVDPDASAVRIPIARAMAIVAERGLPTRPQEGRHE